MDRFSAAESDSQEDVPKNPLSKFVNSGRNKLLKSAGCVQICALKIEYPWRGLSAGLVSANQPAQTYGKVEIKASRNEQKEAKALQAPPEEAARPQLPSVPVPSWAGKPSGGTVLNVVKSGVTVDRISLTEAMTVLGRSVT